MKPAIRTALRMGVILAVMAPSGSAWAMQPMRWTIDTSPDPSSTLNVLESATMTSDTDAWAVGYYLDAAGFASTLIARYNGFFWIQESGFDFPVQDNYLYAVRATSASNAWAVGTHGVPNASQTLIEYDDGSGWTLQNSPSPSSYRNVLTGVVNRSSTSAWAVGYKGRAGLCEQGSPAGAAAATYRPEPIGPIGAPAASKPNYTTLVEHWDGLRWSVQTSPNPGATEDRLEAAGAASATDVWAVGYSIGDSPCTSHTLIEHYDGTKWTRRTSPNGDGFDNVLLGVSAVSPTDVWAVGYHGDPGREKTLIEHYDGSSWKQLKIPGPGIDRALYSVKATSPTNLWAVGAYRPTSSEPIQPLVMHYDGTRWTIQGAHLWAYDTFLLGVAATSDSSAVAVGAWFTSPDLTTGNTLIERCC